MNENENTQEHKVRWFVRAGDEMIPHERGMRGTWDWDAKCSCGWESATGGGTKNSVRRMVDDHKADVRFDATHRWDGREWVAR